MKKLYFLIIIMLITNTVINAQSTQGINYQGIARDNSGNVLANQTVSLRFSILSGSINGSAVYVESQGTTTDGFGLFLLMIGQGTVVSGTFNSINWGSNIYFLKVEIDPAGGSAYQFLGTSQFAAVPYALYAATTGDTTLWKKNGNDIFHYTGHVGIGTTTPMAALDINSTTNGFLPPRLSSLQRNAINAPVEGLVIYNTGCKQLQLWNGTLWVDMKGNPIGPTTPGQITGNAAVCPNSTGNVYTISSVLNATSYNWTVPPNATITTNADTSITVTFGALPNGNITVSAANGCGTSPVRSKTITNSNSTGSQTFNAIADIQTFIVPFCVTSLTIDVYGAQGRGCPGGNGGQAKGTLTVVPGQILYVYVGTSSGWNGGGGSPNNGGGASDVRSGGTNLSNRIIVAGGGGGGSSNCNYGGAGGGNIGGNGGWPGGYGGTQAAGGAGGVIGYGSYNGSAGYFGSGGAGYNGNCYCGGGGGGYYGGGGGGYGTYGGGTCGGGGGGSNYLGGVTPILNNQGVQSGDGLVIISW